MLSSLTQQLIFSLDFKYLNKFPGSKWKSIFAEVASTLLQISVDLYLMLKKSICKNQENKFKKIIIKIIFFSKTIKHKKNKLIRKGCK